MLIAVIVVGSLLLLFFFLELFLYLYTFYTPKKGQNNEYKFTERSLKEYDYDFLAKMVDRLCSYQYEDVYIKSHDRKRLHAKLYRNDKSDTVCIMIHGYRGTARRDFSGGAYEMIKRGFNVLLVDHRGHDLSKGHTITFGVREKLDARSWIDYVRKTFGEDKRIVLVGISMGGATALLTSDYLSEKDLVIADCPYTKPKEMLLDFIRKISKKMYKLFYNLINLSLIIFAHTNLNKDDADKVVSNAKCKILIIHGDNDSLVPYRSSMSLYEKHQDKIRYELFKGAEHGLCYMTDTKRYNSVVDEFVK